MPVICGKSDKSIQWYRRICKVTPRYLEAKKLRESRYYYQNRAKILYKMKLKRLEKNLNPRKYHRRKPLKEPIFPDRKKLRKRKGYLEPIKHHYPKNRRRGMDVCSDGVVV